MERKIEKFLKKWQNDKVGKPLVIYGSKQIGKTFTILKFGRENYKNTIYINTEYNKRIKDLFIKEKSIEKIIDGLQQLTGETIFKGDSIPDNNYIVVVLVFIQNSEGKFLIQKRSII